MTPRGSAAAAVTALLLTIGCDRAPPPSPARDPSAEATTAAPPTAAPPTAAPTQTAAPTATPTPTPATPPTDAARLPAPVDAPVDAPQVDAPPVELLEAQALIPGAATALKPGEQITVDPGATFRVVLKGTFPEARLSLLDGADAMLPSAGAREAGSSTTVTLQPAAPLKPGSAYRLRIDGATTRALRASDGTVRTPVELPILAAGEPPPEPKSRTKRQRNRP